jgi:hypothetical protein
MLELKHNGVFVQTLRAGGWFTLPNGDRVSPAYAGWENEEGYTLTEATIKEKPKMSEQEALEAWRAEAELSFAQFLIGLVSEKLITEAQGNAWLSGTLPTPVLNLITSLPETARFGIRARAVQPEVIRRNSPLVDIMATALARAPEQLDQFFAKYNGA